MGFVSVSARVKIDYGSNKSTEIALYFIYQFSKPCGRITRRTILFVFDAWPLATGDVAVERD